MNRGVEILDDSYKDSVKLLEVTRAMLALEGIDWAWAVMATPANLETLAVEGFTDGLADVTANDLVLVARSEDPDVVTAGLALARETLFSVVATDDDSGTGPLVDLDQALDVAGDTNVAIISVPGPYAALETHKALSHDLDVLLFSDNVSLEDEIALKQRARSCGRLVMGPGAGTAMLAGTGLGFANRVTPGPVGIVAAAGTGAQEAMSLLDRWGVGVSHVIGVGGRDLNADVGGLMTEAGLHALEADAGTEAILLVSKPPSPAVAERLLGAGRSKPIVAGLIGLQDSIAVADGVTVCNTLEQGVVETLTVLGRPVPDLIGSLDADIARAVTAITPARTRLVGLFSGGTLCYEAMTIATSHIGPIHSNTPLDKSWTVPAPDGAHVCLDLGEEEYTMGRPHPMIDPEARIEFLRDQIDDPSVAVVLMDVVLGDGSHESPAAMLAPSAADVVASGATVITYVLGTDQDPQGFAAQQQILRDAGCIVPETSARGALAASAVVTRDPALVHHELASALN